jgi:uncharacterized protein involved in exopolysaccharide biosynthesis
MGLRGEVPGSDAEVALAALERRIVELRAQLADEIARADDAEASDAHHAATAAGATAEATAQRERAEAREAELVDLHAALEAERCRNADLEASRAYGLARRLLGVRRPRG